MAFVLINAEIGEEVEVLKALRKLENVKEAYLIYGVYDIIARVERPAPAGACPSSREHGEAQGHRHLEHEEARQGPQHAHNDCN
ncbi:MAG: hypothetical protein QW057_08640 [Candidatus Bathyarchaeia archaeon]